jgi:hypothetical protein
LPLYGLGGIDININTKNNAAFRMACIQGELSVAEWLYSLGGINIDARDYELFRNVCRSEQLLVAQWMFQLGIPSRILEECLPIAC